MSSSEEQSTVVATKTSNFIVRYWRGEYSLGVSYWVFGVVVTNIALLMTGALVGVVAILLGANERQALLATLPTSAIVMLWSTGGIFRSADNHIKRTHRRGWASAAKVMAIIGWIYLLGELVGALQH